GYVNVSSKLLKDLYLPTTKALNGSSKRRLNTLFVSQQLKTAVKWSLKKLNNLKFIGEKDHRYPAEYEDGAISIHRSLHSPSVWLRLGTKLCTTDIDLTFCFERKRVGAYTSVMIPSYGSDCHQCCEFCCHWMESIVPNPPFSNIFELDRPHHALYLTLKFTVRLLVESCGSDIYMRKKVNISSHFLKTMLLHHQNTCQTSNLDGCFGGILF
ncbi:unnamed protein product, partial [Owenia fusiformis]